MIGSIRRALFHNTYRNSIQAAFARTGQTVCVSFKRWRINPSFICDYTIINIERVPNLESFASQGYRALSSLQSAIPLTDGIIRPNTPKGLWDTSYSNLLLRLAGASDGQRSLYFDIVNDQVLIDDEDAEAYKKMASIIRDAYSSLLIVDCTFTDDELRRIEQYALDLDCSAYDGLISKCVRGQYDAIGEYWCSITDNSISAVLSLRNILDEVSDVID